MPPTAPQIVKHGTKNASSAEETRIARPGAERPDESTRISRPFKEYETRIARPGDNAKAGKQDSIGETAPKAPVGLKAKTGSLGSVGGKPDKKEPGNKPASHSSEPAKSDAAKTPKTQDSDPMPPAAPAIPKAGTGNATDSSGKTTEPAKAQDSAEQYPAIGKLEQLTFGKTSPETPIEDRLFKLEKAVFAKTYEHDSLFDRSDRLTKTLFGTTPPAPLVSPSNDINQSDPNYTGGENSPVGEQPVANAADYQYLDELADNPENSKPASNTVLEGFALELINYERQRRGLGQLEHNHLAQKLADEQIKDLVERGVVSHLDRHGRNPDQRYTHLDGVDAVTENLACLDTDKLGSSKPSKTAVALVLKEMLMQQDDREALLAPEATNLGFSIHNSNDSTRILACLEVLTVRALIHPIPKVVHVGDKIEVAGVVHKPYAFDRISIAWEGTSDAQPAQDDGGEEALPYFPPLDYVAYKSKSEKDHTKAITALKAIGLVACIAGGVFVPPVALAAPLIVMAGPDPGEPKPVSDIPIKGGVKVTGQAFNVKLPVSNEGKEGLYYLTVWASPGEGERPVALSRRTITAKEMVETENVKGSVSTSDSEKKSEEKQEEKSVSKSKSSKGEKEAEKKLDAATDSKPADSKEDSKDKKGDDVKSKEVDTDTSNIQKPSTVEQQITSGKQEPAAIEYTKEDGGKGGGNNETSKSETSGKSEKSEKDQSDSD